MIVYQTSPTGLYCGAVEAPPSPADPGAYLIPAGCVTTPPPETGADQVARWIGDGWSVEPSTAATSPADLFPPSRADEIVQRLTAIDAASARPLRAIATETATAADHARLAALETEAAALRAELLSLPSPDTDTGA